MGQTRTEEDVLRSIEHELRQDREIWSEIEQQLHEIRVEHEPAPPRRGIAWPAVLIAMVVVAAAAFSIGWVLGDQNDQVAGLGAPAAVEITYPSGLENPGVTPMERAQAAQMMARHYPGQGGKGQALYDPLPLQRGGKGQAL